MLTAARQGVAKITTVGNTDNHQLMTLVNSASTALPIGLLGGPVQDLSNFQMAPIPFLSDLTSSTHSPHDILKVWKKINHTLPIGSVKRDIRVLGGCSFGRLSVFD